MRFFYVYRHTAPPVRNKLNYMGNGTFTSGEGWYFVGIGGVSMSALARLLKSKNLSVRGCDDAESGFTTSLPAYGIPVTIGTDEEINESNVVYTGALDESDRRIARAKEAGKRLFTRARLLGMVAEEYPFVLSVAGCHGKTSTTSMLAHIYYRTARAFSCHIGGEDALLGNCYVGGDDAFVTEACEFKRSFLSLNSSVGVILNTDRDHTDCYASDDDIFAAYRTFAGQCEKVVVNAEERARKIPHVLSFGLRTGDVRAEKLRSDGERYAFTVREGDSATVRIRLNVTGKYQIQNALAAYAAARLAGFTAEEIKTGLESFRGVKRRFETVGTLRGAPVICDYAHHPREIAAVLESAHKICDGTLRLVFQPHTYTRTHDFMDEFVKTLAREKHPVLYKTFSARETFFFEGSAAALAARIPDAIYVQSPEQLKNRLEKTVEKDDIVLVLGAGDIYNIAKSIID